jgi:hypothetical protein
MVVVGFLDKKPCEGGMEMEGGSGYCGRLGRILKVCTLCAGTVGVVVVVALTMWLRGTGLG